jgi:nucleotide-binding universal stress UspA family protein
MNKDTAALQIDRPAPVDASDDASPWKRVLVPLDGTPVAEAIIPAVSRLARSLGLEVVLLRAVRDEPPRVVGAGRHIVIDQTEERAREAEEYLRAIAARLSAGGLRVRTVVRAGDAAREILDGARESAADLIAMATHGRGALGRLLYGSVTDAVLHRAHLPVIVERAPEAEKGTRAA